MAVAKRVCESNATPYILNLPFEITHQIIDLCRPDGVEAIALSCKRLFAVAQPLIRSHEACKRQSESAALERTGGTYGHVVLRGPYDFLAWLTALPKDQQIDQLRYFKDIIHVKSPRYNKFIDFELIEKIKSELPHLEALIQSAAEDLVSQYTRSSQGWKSESLEHLQNWVATYALRTVGSAAGILDARMRPRSSLIGQTTTILDIDLEDLLDLRRPVDGYYAPALLGMFTELRSLVTRESLDLPRMIGQLDGQTYFQNIEELYLIEGCRCSSDQILNLCLLPRLRVLMLAAFSSQHDILRNGRRRIDAQQLPPSRAPLESLAVRGIEHRYEDLHRLFARLPKLRTLLWEDDTDISVGCTDMCCFLDEDDLNAELENFKEVVEPDRDLAIRAQYPDLYSAIENWEQAFNTEADFDTDCAAHVAIDWPWRKGIYSPELGPKRLAELSKAPTDILFKPSVLLHRIVTAYADQLEHLAILVPCGRWSSASIQRKYKILHFHALPHLKYLEFDTKVVRPKKGEEYLLPSLSKLLPSNVEVVSVVTHYPYSEQLVSLCEDVAEAKLHGLMKLRRIIVKDPVRYGRQDTESQVFVAQIKDTFAEIGITIEWRPVLHNGLMNVTMDWDNPKVVDGLDVVGLTSEYT